MPILPEIIPNDFPIQNQRFCLSITVVRPYDNYRKANRTAAKIQQKEANCSFHLDYLLFLPIAFDKEMNGKFDL